MKIFRPKNVVRERRDVFCRLTFANEVDRQRFAMGDNFRGLPLSEDLLKPYRVRRSTEFAGGDTNPCADKVPIAFSTDVMAVSRRALDVLLPHIGAAVQVVPLVFDEGEYALLNIVKVIDALDFEQSEKNFYRTDGALKAIKRHAFRPEAVRDEWIFKIPQVPARAFVTQRFVELVQQAGLTGFAFEELWSYEPQAVAARS